MPSNTNVKTSSAERYLEARQMLIRDTRVLNLAIKDRNRLAEKSNLTLLETNALEKILPDRIRRYSERVAYLEDYCRKMEQIVDLKDYSTALQKKRDSLLSEKTAGTLDGIGNIYLSELNELNGEFLSQMASMAAI